MSIPMPPMAYEVCSPAEKLHRLKVSYANNRITLEELERYTNEAVAEQAWDERSAAGLLSEDEQKAYGKHMTKVLDAIRKRDYARANRLRADWSRKLAAQAA